jgi:hypothetical protein
MSVLGKQLILSRAAEKGHLAGFLVLDSIRGARIYNIHFRDVPLFGKLARHAFGDSFKVPSEVNVKCFLRLQQGHFDTSNFRKLRRVEHIGESLGKYEQRFSSFPFIESLPRRNR